MLSRLRVVWVEMPVRFSWLARKKQNARAWRGGSVDFENEISGLMCPWSGAALLAICALGRRARVELAALRSTALRQPHRRLFRHGRVGIRLCLDGFCWQGERQNENPETLAATGRGAHRRGIAGVAFVLVYAGTNAGPGKDPIRNCQGLNLLTMVVNLFSGTVLQARHTLPLP